MSRRRGEVEFIARYREAGEVLMLHGRSRFIREDGLWYYLDSTHPATVNLGRNAPCWCGSGNKFKRCHGAASGS